MPIVCLMVSFLACAKKDNRYTPRTVTTINLDELANNIEIEKIPVKVIYNNEWYESNPEWKEIFIPVIRNLTEGPDSTLYVLDFLNSRVVQLSQDGKYLRSIGGPGSGPGEFMHPFERLYRSNKYIYIPDTYGLRLQIFDLDCNYKRTITNTNIERGIFSIGKNDMILYAPPQHAIPQDPYMILVHDSLGKEIKRIGAIEKDDNFVFDNHFRKAYYLVASEWSEYIWCVFMHFPIIRKYDYNGKFVEEIRFEAQSINTELKESTVFLKKQRSPKGIDGGVVVFDNPHITCDGDLLINLSLHGNMQISGKDEKSRIVKKYEFVDTPEDVLGEKKIEQTLYMARSINGKLYAFFHDGIIVKAKK